MAWYWASQNTLDLTLPSKYFNMKLPDRFNCGFRIEGQKQQNSDFQSCNRNVLTYMNLPIGVVGLTTGVLLFVRDAVLVTLLWSVGEEVTVVRVGVAPVGVAPVNDNVEPVSAAELRLKKYQNGSIWTKMDQYGSKWINIDQNGSIWIKSDQNGSIWKIYGSK